MKTPDMKSAEFVQAEQAVLWCIRFSERKMTREEQRKFSDWLNSDPSNMRAFEQAASTWQEVHASEASPDFLPLRVEALESLQHRHRLRATRLTRWPWRRYALAASIMLLALIGTLAWWIQSPTTYATGLGERRVVSLSDGSTISLDAASEIAARLTQTGRVIRLIRGRAKFSVARDPLRPFSVAAADRVVVATGTEFSVELVNDHVEVILYKGHVSVLGPSLQAVTTTTVPERSVARTSKALAFQDLNEGQQLVAATTGPNVTVAPINVAESLEWETGQLEFVDEPLATAVDRMNRYPGPRLAVLDAQTGALRITGVFTPGDVQSFVEGVTAAFPVQVEVSGDARTFRRRIR